MAYLHAQEIKMLSIAGTKRRNVWFSTDTKMESCSAFSYTEHPSKQEQRKTHQVDSSFIIALNTQKFHAVSWEERSQSCFKPAMPMKHQDITPPGERGPQYIRMYQILIVNSTGFKERPRECPQKKLTYYPHEENQQK